MRIISSARAVTMLLVLSGGAMAMSGCDGSKEEGTQAPGLSPEDKKSMEQSVDAYKNPQSKAPPKKTPK